ncbi:MAG: hypothetical protein IJJ23_09310 [Clostridia bacterium]|nr:hypothetical protein [Clostridia bacterium]
MMSMDTLKALGMPPAVFELPGGSPSDTPPILREDLLACYLTNAALGAKGVNIYIYTGGPNVPGTGETADIYDYNAIIRADGEINDTYAALCAFGDFTRNHAWMQRVSREASVQVGFEWNTLRCREYDGASAGVAEFIEKGILYALMCSDCAPEMKLLTGELDPGRPLIIPGASMSAAAQQAAADYILNGGSALILPVFPVEDLDGSSCGILWEALGRPEIVPAEGKSPAVVVDGVGNVYGIHRRSCCRTLPPDAQVLARDASSGEVISYVCKAGKGEYVFFGGQWEMSTFPQARMMERLLKRLGAKPCVRSDNRNVFTALWKGEDGEATLMLMNLYSGAQHTSVHVGADDYIGEFDLAPMEVKVVDLKIK